MRCAVILWALMISSASLLTFDLILGPVASMAAASVTAAVVIAAMGGVVRRRP